MEILAPVFGIFTSFILLYYLSSLNRSNIFLALFFLCCNLVVMVYFGLHYSKMEFWEGICFVHFLPLSFLLGPTLFYYVKHTVSENKSFSWTDALHLIPAIFVGFATLPFTRLPLEVKTEIAHQIVNFTEDYSLNFNWVTFEQLLYGRSIHVILYAILSIGYFFWNKHMLLQKYGSIPTNHPIIQRWFFTLITLQVVIASTSLGHMITLYFKPVYFLGISSQSIFSEEHFFRICGGGFFIQNFFLFLFPNILYGNISYSLDLDSASTYQKIKSSFAKQVKALENTSEFEMQLIEYLKDAPFIKKDFTLSQMSFDLKVPERNLSAYFNNDLNKTFGEWKNDKRIEYVVQLIEAGHAKVYTIEAMSAAAGFQSRSKFIDAFKSRQGVTPSAFIKSKKPSAN
ncbi:MAG: helix-turn-helix transcriptional regulator [Cytophagaceae bacterium]|nr:helix-turn-helix transcriptional regulator [Cytophagaceae bacterium]